MDYHLHYMKLASETTPTIKLSAGHNNGLVQVMSHTVHTTFTRLGLQLALIASTTRTTSVARLTSQLLQETFKFAS